MKENGSDRKDSAESLLLEAAFEAGIEFDANRTEPDAHDEDEGQDGAG